jgi:hypothetical protein
MDSEINCLISIGTGDWSLYKYFNSITRLASITRKYFVVISLIVNFMSAIVGVLRGIFARSAVHEDTQTPFCYILS